MRALFVHMEIKCRDKFYLSVLGLYQSLDFFFLGLHLCGYFYS